MMEILVVFSVYKPVLYRTTTLQFLCFVDKGCSVMNDSDNYPIISQAPLAKPIQIVQLIP